MPAVDGYLFSINEMTDATMQISVRRSTHRISARWRDGKLKITVPPGLLMGQVICFIRENADRILACRPALRYTIGQELKFDNFTATISRQSLVPHSILLQGETYTPRILVGDEVDIDTDESTAIISRLLCIVARAVAPSLLIPQAREVSARLGVKPTSWSISRGHRTLGRCNHRGEIALSEVLALLPADLREYIICHELAHLSEFNHSPRFHLTCDRYLNGREKSLINKLHNHKWPIIRK